MSDQPAERAGAKTAGKIFLGLGAVFALAAAFALWGYFTFLRYERVAARHVPEDASSALRLDIEQVVLFEPVRRHLLPLLEELGPGAGMSGSRFDRLEKAIGARVEVDLRELVWANGPGLGDWVLVLGGKFPNRGVAAAVAQLLAEEGSAWVPSGQAFQGPGGLALGQASDGAFIIASSLERAEKALPARTHYADIGLGSGKAGGFFYRARPQKNLQGELGALFVPAPLSDIASAEGELLLVSDVTLEARLVLRPGADAGVARDQLTTLAGAPVVLARLLGVSARGLAENLKPTVTQTETPDCLRVKLRLGRPWIDNAARVLALWFRGGA
jgi:hypothetical protein